MAALTYVVFYGVYFGSSADGLAAKAANGSILLGGMTPAAAAAAFPTGTVVAMGAFAITGLTGVPGPIPGAYADLLNGGPSVAGVTYAPTSRLLATDTSATSVRTTVPPVGDTVADIITIEWDGTLIFDGGGVIQPAAGIPTPIKGKFQAQVVAYTGTGVNGRAVATTVPLNVGLTLIYVLPQITRQACFRHNSPTMLETVRIGGGGSGSVTGGILSFTASGFTVGDDGGTTIFANQVGEQYTALVFNDTGNTYLALGQYTGRVDVSTNGTFATGSSVVISGGWTANDLGRTFTIFGVTYVISGIIDANRIAITPPSQTGGLQNIFSSGSSGSFFLTPWQPSLVWDLGRQGVFADEDMIAGESLTLVSSATSLTVNITSLSSNPKGFGIGTGSDVNFAQAYYWGAFHLPHSAAVAEAFFKVFTLVGTAAAIDTVTLGFTPQFVAARQRSAVAVASGWRGPWHVVGVFTGLSWDPASGTIPDIRSLDVNSADLGPNIAPAGISVFGWALRGGRIIIQGDPPALTPTSDPPALPPIPPEICVAPFLPPTGCVSPADLPPTIEADGCAACQLGPPPIEAEGCQAIPFTEG